MDFIEGLCVAVHVAINEIPLCGQTMSELYFFLHIKVCTVEIFNSCITCCTGMIDW